LVGDRAANHSTTDDDDVRAHTTRLPCVDGELCPAHNKEKAVRP
jgi:hypothetical protein